MTNWRNELNSPVPINVGDGWRALVEYYYDEIAQCDHVTIAQVKEKFGLLTMYVHHDHEVCQDEECWRKFGGLASHLSGISSRVCEDCGKYGKIGRTENRYWIRTLCDECDNTINKPVNKKVEMNDSDNENEP